MAAEGGKGKEKCTKSTVPSNFFPNVPRRQRSHVDRPKSNGWHDANINMRLSKPDSVPPRTFLSANFCETCGVYFRYDKHYIDHCKEKHGLKLPYKCFKCDMKFARKRSLINHGNARHPKNREFEIYRSSLHATLSCEICGMRCGGVANLENHALTQHNGVPLLKCWRCGEKFRKKKFWDSHNQMHSAADFTCKICKCSQFSRSDTLEDHEGVCAELQFLKTTGINKVNISELEEMVKLKSCSKCHTNFESYGKYKKHMMQYHRIHKMYACVHCDKSYVRRNQMRAHVSFKHAKEDLKAFHQGEKSLIQHYTKGLIYTCPHCGGEFRGLTNFESHGLNDHPREKIFSCGDCGEGFTVKSSRDRHVKEKHGEAKIRCQYCTKCYSRPDQLREHERRRHLKFSSKEGKGSHYCEICQKTISCIDKGSLRKHIKSHKIYESCHLCGERFHRVYNVTGLKEHIRLRHPCNENTNGLLQTAAAVNVERGAVTVKEESEGSIAKIENF